jgi:protein O-GlcNAc transferase
VRNTAGCYQANLLTHLHAFWIIATLLQFVSPLQYAHIYSEKIVHLPHCYFVNDYKQVCFYELVMVKLGYNCLYMLYVFWLYIALNVFSLDDLVIQKNQDVLDPNCQPKRSDYGLPEAKFLFACFNQLYKMDPEIFNTW